MTTVRLASNTTNLERVALASTNKLSQKPSLLVSHYYIKNFDRFRNELQFADWAMDSGAFSAKNAGAEIRLDDYISACQERLESDPSLVEVFSLDVIGDHKASYKNWQAMMMAGLPAIPTFHIGSPWSALTALKGAPKIALGGMVRRHPNHKLEWCRECFARVWPKRLHGFGVMSPSLLRSVPFHSVDATNWQMGSKYGKWRAFPGITTKRGPSKNLTVEVEWCLSLERELKGRWHKEMKLLED